MIETSHKVVEKDDIVEEAIRFVDEGRRVILPVNGYSMLPFIIGGKESVELVKPETVKVGDVVLAWINGCRYVVHRIIHINGDQVELMGDGNLTKGEYCHIDEVKAKVEYVVGAKGKKRYLYTRGRVIGARIWWHLRGIRIWLLRIRKLLCLMKGS